MGACFTDAGDNSSRCLSLVPNAAAVWLESKMQNGRRTAAMRMRADAFACEMNLICFCPSPPPPATYPPHLSRGRGGPTKVGPPTEATPYTLVLRGPPYLSNPERGFPAAGDMVRPAGGISGPRAPRAINSSLAKDSRPWHWKTRPRGGIPSEQ